MAATLVNDFGEPEFDGLELGVMANVGQPAARGRVGLLNTVFALEERANIIVSPAHKAGEETDHSVGRGLPVHALLATAACEATGQSVGPLGRAPASARKLRHLRASVRMRCQAEWQGQHI